MVGLQNFGKVWPPHHCDTNQNSVTQTPTQIPMVAIWVSLFIRFENFHAEDAD